MVNFVCYSKRLQMLERPTILAGCAVEQSVAPFITWRARLKRHVRRKGWLCIERHFLVLSVGLSDNQTAPAAKRRVDEQTSAISCIQPVYMAIIWMRQEDRISETEIHPQTDQ